MNTFIATIFLIVGLIVLLKGADYLVDGAVGVAKKFGISPFIIGLTVVAMGTSAPEVAASITAAVKELGDTAIGNVYGSNIANLALIGGICAIISPIAVSASALRKELPVMLVSALLLLPALAIDSYLSRDESILLLILFVGLVAYTVYMGLQQAKANPTVSEHAEKYLKTKQASFGANVVYVLVGLVALALGADLAIRGAVVLGKAVGLSDAVIGLTIMAVGTSLPELVTCVNAALKGHDDISIGNLVGSNVFNTLLVIGAAGAIKPFQVSPRLIGTDYWVMIGVSLVFIAMAFLKKAITRLNGTILLAIYVSYIIYLGMTRGV
ncbi:MAG: calcium/sodium antiporter [Sedimentisphaerales bacterium]|nr:calcium/sodium antiporter [Sedimentisphaerales bacterium]